jgi:hypothetical protein
MQGAMRTRVVEGVVRARARERMRMRMRMNERCNAVVVV